MVFRLRALFAAAACIACASNAQASGAWTTYIKMLSCTDLVARGDTVWFATGEAGLLRYVGPADRFESITREPGGLASNSLTALAFDRSGRLWAGTPGKGVSRLSSDGAAWDLVNAFDGLPSDSVTVLEADGDTVWIGTTRGIALWNGREIAGAVPDGGNPSPFGNNRITGIVVSGGELFVGTPVGVYRSSLASNLSTWTLDNSGLLNTNIIRLASDGTNIFALGGGALHRWLPGTATWGLSGGFGSVPFMGDASGVLWAYSTQGIYRYVGGLWQQVTAFPGALANNDGSLRVAVDAGGKFWAANARGLYEQSAPTWPLHVPPGPPGNDLQNVIVDGPRTYVNDLQSGFGRLTAGAWRHWLPGVIQTASDTAFVEAAFLFSLAVDRQGRKWIGAWDRAIERLDDSGPIPRFLHVRIPNPLPPDNAVPDTLRAQTWGWASAVDSVGNVWIGSDTPSRGELNPYGITRFTADGVQTANLQTTNSGLTENQIRALSVDSTGTRMWVGLAGKGVSRFDFDPNVSITIPTVQPVGGTASFDVFSVVAHNDSIWVLTTSELRRINRSTAVLSATALDIPAGPPQRGAVRLMDVGPDGTVWVGSTQGVRRYRPGRPSEDYTTANSPISDNEVRGVCVDRATGVVWFATASGLSRFDPGYVPPPAPTLPRLDVKLYPNPAVLTGAGIDLRLFGNATSYQGEIFDLGGRRLSSFAVNANRRPIWNGRDDDGLLVKPGLYFIRVTGGGRSATARVALVR